MRQTLTKAASLAPLLLAALFACGGSSGGGGGNDAIKNCTALCTVEGKGAGCNAGNVAACNQFCASAQASLSGNCGSTANAYWICGQNLTWTCPTANESGTTSDHTCDSQLAAFNSSCGGH